jgi:hypothetical protein
VGRQWSIGLWLGALLSPSQGYAQYPFGGELQVNSYTFAGQRYPALATEADGDFVVVWHRPGSGNTDIFLRRFTSSGVGLDADVRLNVFTTGSQSRATVDLSADGAFVVAWTSAGQDGDSNGVFGRRLDAAGTPLASELQINTITAESQYDPALAMDAEGDFVVVWSTYTGAPSYRTDVFGQRFDSAGTKLGVEFLLNTVTDEFDFGPAVGMGASGEFVVVWASYRGEANDFDVFGRRFTSAGTSIGGEFRVNATTADYQALPDVAVGGGGSFIVAWTSDGQDGGVRGVFAQRFSSSGVKVGAEFRVNTYTPNAQELSAVEMDADGSFVVTWSSVGQDDPLSPTTSGVFGRRFDSSGAAIATEFQVNSYTTDHQRHSAIGVDGDGDFVVAWESTGQDGANEGIFAQRFSSNPATPTPSPTPGGPTATPTPSPIPSATATATPTGSPGGVTLDVDGDGSASPLTDGLLVLRFQFGFTGPILVDGAINELCSRCEGPAVQTYLSNLGLVLDIDGDGLLDALTDGLLVLRYLFGFTGPVLVDGAISEQCSRCDEAAVATYLQSID